MRHSSHTFVISDADQGCVNDGKIKFEVQPETGDYNDNADDAKEEEQCFIFASSQVWVNGM